MRVLYVKGMCLLSSSLFICSVERGAVPRCRCVRASGGPELTCVFLTIGTTGQCLTDSSQPPANFRIRTVHTRRALLGFPILSRADTNFIFLFQLCRAIETTKIMGPA
jgi:hypothetical protein